MSSSIPKNQLQIEISRFGKNLRRARVHREVTQERLAEGAEIAVRTLQRIEAGQTNILLTTAKRLKKSLDCDWDELME